MRHVRGRAWADPVRKASVGAELGVVDLLLDDRSRCHPSPLPAVQRLLSTAVAGAEITEEFQLPLPLIEASPCEPADAEHAKAGEAKPVSILRLPVGWKRPDSVRKVIRVEGASDLSEIWGRDFGRVTVETRAPPAVALIPRSDPFTRF